MTKVGADPGSFDTSPPDSEGIEEVVIGFFPADGTGDDEPAVAGRHVLADQGMVALHPFAVMAVRGQDLGGCSLGEESDGFGVLALRAGLGCGDAGQVGDVVRNSSGGVVGHAAFSFVMMGLGW